jgi:hypothetical protein
MAIDTGASVTISLPDIVTGLSEMDPTAPYALQMSSGQTLPILKEASVNVPLVRGPLFVANIADEFILGLDVLRNEE